MATRTSLTLPSGDAGAARALELPADAVEVGRVIGAWGIKGAFKVQPHATDPQALFSSRRWFIQHGASGTELLRITQVREQGALVVATAQEVADRTAAQALQGAPVFIARSSFPTAGDGEYYWIDLLGSQVVSREGVLLGEVSGLLDTGVHSVLRVRRPDVPQDASLDETERLIPFVAAYIDSVDLAERLIRVDWGVDY